MEKQFYYDYRERPESERGIDEAMITSNGLKLIVINDREGNFIPIVSVNMSPFETRWEYNFQ